MSFLRGSANYVWCTTSVLGKGATGAVFQGVNKNTGEPVAVKTFNQLSHMRPHDVQLREFEVLKKVKHENIVKLLAIEEEQEGRGKVIVMELCTGGSLFNILDDPENAFGLKESEFLLVLDHLAAGMKHLRDNNLVHRDLKPGNIMKFICDDGTTVYKLTDFGAARELEEDQQFMSLYGTEEYLHPDMYERAVLRKPVGKTFGATVDLWSIGVTLYHVATGNLPFRPYGGRRNKETMYYITTKKASGVISGTQSSADGPIDWCRTLPKSCELSAGLKTLVTPLLAGLLEVDQGKIWTFEKFFSEVTKLLLCNTIYIFNIHNVQLVKIYLPPDSSYRGFQEAVQEQTSVTHANQILLYNSKSLLLSVSESTLPKDYPSTTQDDPIFLFSNENNNVCFEETNDLPKLPTFPPLVNVESDASIAKTVCSIAHAAKRQIDNLSLCSKLINDSVVVFSENVRNELKQVLVKSNELREINRYMEMIVETIMRCQNTVHSVLGEKSSACRKNWKDELNSVVKELLNGLSVAVQQLYYRYVTLDSLIKEWDKDCTGIKCCWKARIPQRAKSTVQRLRESWQHMMRDRATRSLTYNDEQFHVLERMKMDVTVNCLIKNLLERDVINTVTQMSDSLADWYKVAQTIYLQSRILDKDVDAYLLKLQKFLKQVKESDQCFHESISKGDHKHPVIKHRTRIRNQDSQSLRTTIQELESTQYEYSNLVDENCEIINKLLSISEGKLVFD